MIELREIIMMHISMKQGPGISEVVRQTGLRRKAARKHLQRGLRSSARRGSRSPRLRLPVPFGHCLREQVAACSELSGRRLWREREIAAPGHVGGCAAATDFLREARPPAAGSDGAPSASLTFLRTLQVGARKMKDEKLILQKIMCLALFSSLAFPANAQQTEESEEARREIELIEVIGYRDSLRRNIGIKKESDTIVDAVSAEDIGQFPDINVADALQRITGVQVEKDERTGESVRVSIRGTAPHLNRALLNNQQIASATSSNRTGELRDRSFNYFLLPTELVETLEVHKSAEANVDEGSVGGTVIVRTRRPLDADANSGAVSARYFHFDNAGENKPHLSGLYSWKNDAETFGFNVAYVHKDSETLLNAKRNLAGYFRPTDYDSDGVTERIPVHVGANQYSSDYSLDTPFVTLQFAPRNDLDVVFTALNSVTEHRSQGIYSFAFPSLAAALSADEVLTIEDGTVVKGQIPSCCSIPGRLDLTAGVYDSGAYQGEFETTAFDLKTTLDRETWQVSFQVGHSFADGFASDRAATFSTETGIDFDLTSGVMEVTLDDGLTPDDYRFYYTHFNKIRNESDETYLQSDVLFNLNNDYFSSIETGVKFREHNKAANLIKRDFDEEGVTLASFAGAPLDNFLVGATPAHLWSFNIAELEKWQNANPEDGLANRSFDHLQHRFNLNEEVYSAYLKANFETENFRGNLGVRAVETRTNSVVKRYEEPVWRPRNVEDARVQNNYTDVLPSININYVGYEDVILRFAAAKVLSRPNYDSVTAREIRTCGTRGCVGLEGNPDLKPFRLTQYDLSAEWYIDDSSFLAFGLFHKDIESYITTEEFTAIRDYAEVGSEVVVVQREFELTRPVNGLGGTIEGFEVNYQQDIAYGFGVQANYTYADADLEETPEQVAAGEEEVLLDHSEDTYNATVYYQAYGLGARLSYTFRSEYRYDLGTVARGLYGYKGDFGQFDFNASYAITDDVNLILQVINLGDEQITWYASKDNGLPDPGRPLGLFNHGRRYAVGLNMRF